MVDYNVPENTLLAILANNDLCRGESLELVSLRDRELALADLYMWLSTSSSSTTGEYVSDGGWQHQKAAKNVVDRTGLRQMAQRLYAKWDSDKASEVQGAVMRNLY